MEKILKYNTAVQVYTLPVQAPIDPYCNGITIKNSGNTNVIFQGDLLAPGESKFIGGNRAEVYIGRIDLNFALPTPAPVTPQNSCTVTVKYYVDIV